MNTFDLTLDLSKRGLVQTVPIRQGDQNGTTIKATITDHGAAASTSGMTARICMRLPNGTEYYRKAATLSGNTATVTIDEAQAASAVGRTDVAYFQLLQGTTVVASTESFTVVVLPDALADATVPESYDSAIQDAIDNLDAAVENLPATVEDVLADHPEWTTTVQYGAVTDAKLYQGTDGILARNARLMYRLDNLLTNALPEGDVATATDAAKTPLAGLALYGRSTQDGTPTPSAPVPIVSVGGNLVNMAYTYPCTRTNSGITWTVNADGSIHAKGTATGNSWSHETALAPQVYLPAGTYTTYAVAPDGSVATGFRPRIALADGAVVAYDNGVKTFTVASDTTATVMLVCNTGTVTDADMRLALYAGSTAYPYVPYGNAGLWAIGLNLFAGRNASASGNGVTRAYDAATNTFTASGTATTANVDIDVYCVNPILVPEGGALTFSLTGTVNVPVSTSYLVFAHFVDGGWDEYHHISNGSVTFTSMGGKLVDAFKIRQNPSAGAVSISAKIQVQRGSTATAYQPYESTVTPIPLDGHELRSLPDGTRDEVTVDARGHAVLVQRVGSVTYDGSSDEGWRYETGGNYGSNFYVAVSDAARGSYKTRILLTCCPASPANYAIQDTGYISNSGNLNLTISTTLGISTVDGFKSWLASNPTTAVYPLATPVTHDLGYVAAVPLVGPDLTAQAIPTAPMQLTYERDLNATLARLESAIATLA